MYIVHVNGVDYPAPDVATLQVWANEGRLLPETLVWVESDQVHRRASELGGIYFKPSQQTYAAPPYSGPAQYMRAASVPNNLFLAIFSTVCCCMPFGVVSIVYAAQVDGLASKGDVARAQEAAEKAKNWAVASILCGLLGSCAYIMLVGAAGGFR